MSGTFDYGAFLNYSSKAKETIHAIAERPKKDGLRLWLDAWGDPANVQNHHEDSTRARAQHRATLRFTQPRTPPHHASLRKLTKV